MKKLQSMVSCLIAAVMCLVFTGCSPDPDPEPVVEPISVVGTWEHSYDNGYDLYQFNANGTGKGVSSYGESWTFSYSLNAETMKLVYTEENESAKVWSIEFISDSSIEVDGEWILSKTNKKMEDVKVPSLTGTWRYDFSSGYTYMYFDGKGFGWEQEYDPADGGWHGKDYFKYSYSPSEKEIIFTYDEDGYREEIKVISLSDSELKLLDFMDEGTTIWKFVSKEEVETGEKEKPISSISGTWRESWGDGPRSYTAYSFFDDGTGLYFDKGNGAERFTYTYDKQAQIVNIEFSKYQNRQLKISKLTTNTLVMDDDEYKKSELTYDMLILGEWYLHVDAYNSIGKSTRVLFSAGSVVEGLGTYEAKDYYDGAGSEDFYYSFSGLSNKVNGTWSISNNKLSIKGESQIAGDYIIEGLVVNGCRLIRESNPNEQPYLFGGWHDR